MKPFAWSYSQLSSFETCPRRHYLTKVSKEVSEGQSDAMLWGNRVHKALELRIRDRQPFTPEMEAYEPIAQTIEAAAAGGRVDTEQKLACDRSYQPVAYFAPTCWVRGITDFAVEKKNTAFIGDYKTGNPTPASAQLRLTAAMTFAHRPHIDRIITAFVWLKDGTTTWEEFKREDVPIIWQEFHPRVTRMEQAIAQGPPAFPPKPSGLCSKWCPVPNRMCEHSGKN